MQNCKGYHHSRWLCTPTGIDEGTMGQWKFFPPQTTDNFQMTSVTESILQGGSKFSNVAGLEKRLSYILMILRKIIEDVILLVIATKHVKYLRLNLTSFCY